METEKDDIIDCRIEDMGVYGEGITHVGGQTVFIPGAIVGERVSARVVLAKPTFAHAVLVRIIERSQDRVEPPCPYFKQCGGCSLQHMSYAAQLKLKRSVVKNALKKYAGLDFPVSGTVASPEIYHYRNKLSLPVRHLQKRGTVRGMFAKRSHRIVEIDGCMLQQPGIFQEAQRAFDFAVSHGLKGYGELTGSGDLRHIAVRRIGDETSLTYVLNGERKEFEKTLDKEWGDDVSLFVNLNTSRGNVILGDKTVLKKNRAWGSLCGMRVPTHPQAFFQVNDGVREKLYAAVVERIDEGDSVVDAYCGGGLMSALIARKAKSVIGVEIAGAAIDCAEVLKAETGIDNLSFICGDCAEKLPGALERAAGENKRTVVLDPPKAGCAPSVIDSLIKSEPEKIIYVSCNPATLARDCALLLGGGYTLTEATPFDMFPQTTAVETLVVLSKKIPDTHINIDVEFGEGEGQFSLSKIKERAEARKPKEKVTYKMIQDYIEKTYGFKVHTAYIAEVKRDLGLPMYDAPNAVEELKHPRPHPTPKMVEAIKETLKHFEII